MTVTLDGISPPFSIDAERAVLGAVLTNEKCLSRVLPIIRRPQSFFREAHVTIFGYITRLADAGEAIDTLTIKAALDADGRLAEVGGHAYVSSLMDGVPDIANIERYAAIVAEKDSLRSIMKACNNGMRRAANSDESVDIASELTLRLSALGIADDRASRGIVDVLRETRLAADDRAEAGRMIGIPTGYPSLDRLTQGLPRKALSVLAAASSHGKTTYAINIADNLININDWSKTVTYSLEMSKEAISDSLRSKHTGIPMKSIRAWRYLNDMDRARVIEAEAMMAHANTRWFFADAISEVTDLVADARKRKASGGLDLAIVDYLQLVSGVDDVNRERTVNQIAWTLFQMAKDLDIAVLALSQVTPAAEMRQSKRLSIDDLRDSKAIGHHARVVMMLQRPWQQNKTDWRNGEGEFLPCKATLQLEKNSMGETGDIEYHFQGPTQTFTEGGCNDDCYYRKRRTT